MESENKLDQDEKQQSTSSQSASSSELSVSPASSRSGSQPSSREQTPVFSPKFQYNKDALIKLRDKPLSRSRPKCLSPDHDNTDGLWDPDLWIRRFDSSRGNSPSISAASKDRKRPTSELDREIAFKRKSSVSDPKGRLREEEEDGLGIVLSPQRRSFGTGCHVSVMPTRRPSSPNDAERDGHGPAHDQRKGSKIGSGRIQISHDRHERDYRDARVRYDRDDHRPFDRPNPLDRFRRDDRAERDRESMMRERDGRDNRDRLISRESQDRLDSRDSRDRIDSRDSRDRQDTRDSRDRAESRDSRDRLEPRDSRDRLESWDNRDRPDCRDSQPKEKYRREYERKYDRGGRRDYRRQEAEPEWFTGGPSSQSETIELHGFDATGKDEHSETDNKGRVTTRQNQSSKKDPAGSRKNGKPVESNATCTKTTLDKLRTEEVFEDEKPHSRAGSISVADRNGSLETNESSSPEGSPHHVDRGIAYADRPQHRSTILPNQNVTDFDFNEFFKIDNIPGLTDPAPVEQDPSCGSRFRQWFQMRPGSQPGSRNDSRRSSINDEFSYLNDLLNLSGGQKSPVVVSPPLHDNRLNNPRYADTKYMDVQQQQHQGLRHMLKKYGTTKVKLGAPTAFSPSATADHSEETTQAHALREAEANLKAMLLGGMGMSTQQGNPSQTGYPPTPSDPTLAKIVTAAELEASLMIPGSNGPPRPCASNGNLVGPPSLRAVSTAVTLPSPGKVTTVSELEAGLKQLGLNKDAQAVAAINAANKQQHKDAMLHRMDHIQKVAEMPSQASADMAAFNKLLTMMKASGVLNETPKMPKLLQAKLLQQQQQQVKNIQQKQVQDQILKFMVHNPGLMPKGATNASPISPSLSLQPPPSPRCPSPAIPQQNLLQPQQSPSPRAPSPIMFGSQPPLHLTAPSPIHPTQQPQSSKTLSPNTLQVTQGNSVRALQRVPSPQELIVHTQAIMQNALIKKQLEDQKERFIKKQQGRAKSPNPMGMTMTMMLPAGTSTSITSTPTTQAKVQLTPAFTPTSVIRKMVNDKADRQLEGDSHDLPIKAPVRSLVRMDSSDELQDGTLGSGSGYQGYKVDTPPIMTVASDGSISIPVPITPKAANKSCLSPPHSQDDMYSPNMMNDRQTSVYHGLGPSINSTHSHIYTSHATHIGQAKPPRALIGQGVSSTGMPMTINSGLPVSISSVMATNVPQPVTVTHHNFVQGSGGRAIVKGTAQSSVPSTQQHLIANSTTSPQKVAPLTQRPIVGSQPLGIPSSTHMPVSGSAVRLAGSGCRPRPGAILHPGTVAVSPPNSTNPLLMQRMVHPGANPLGRGFQQLGVNQLSPLSAMQVAQAQAQQRPMEPRLQAHNTALYPILGSSTSPLGAYPVNSLNRALSPQPAVTPGASIEGFGGPLSPGLMSHAGVNATNLGVLFGAHASVEGNLAKWFNTDMLKHQAPAMPPLPSQGQKVLTVDEIERRQQMVTN